MKIALIKNGIVENVIVSSLEFAQANYPDHICVDVTNSRVGPGFSYVDGVFTPPTVSQEE
jgi:hypothetical protein